MYCAQAEIESRIGQQELVELTDDGGLSAVDEGIVSAAIADAESEINAHLGVRYAVPLSEVPILIKNIAVTLTVYKLYARRVKTFPDAVKETRDNAVKLLKSIAEGKADIGAASKPAAATRPSGAETNVNKDSQVFTKEKMEGF